MTKENVPWYKWRFTIPGVVFTALFVYCAWTWLIDGEEGLGHRIAGALIFLALAVLFGILEWRNRKPYRFTIRNNDR